MTTNRFGGAPWWTWGLCLALLLTGCRDKYRWSEDDVPAVKVNISSAKSKDLSGKAEIVEVVALQTTEASLLREISKLTVGREYILTMSANYDKVCLWGRDGRFLREIGRLGNGPNEYLDIIDAQLDEADGRIYVLDRLKQRMMVYNIEGRLLSNIYTGMWIDSFLKTDDGYWAYVPSNWPGSGYALMLLDDKFGKVKEKFFPQEAFFPSTMVPRFYSDGKGEHYFCYPFSNVIYKLRDDRPEPWLKVDFGKHTLPYDKIRTLGDKTYYGPLISEEKYVGNMDDLVFCGDKVAFSFSEIIMQGATETFRACYAAAGGHLDLYDSSTRSFSSDPDSRFPLADLFLNKPIAADGDLWVYQVQPHDMSEENLAVIREKVSTSVFPDSNPLLFFVRQNP